MLPARWLLPEAAPPDLPLAEQVLWRRGWRDPAARAGFLSPSLSQLHSPAQLKTMDRAVARLRSAVAERQPILLYGDYDVDGTMAIVLLRKAIELAGGVVQWHVPHRVKDGYGMRPEVVDEAAAAGVRLIVSVDTGIRAAAVVAHAATLGIDVIVTDHHLPEAELPPAVAVLNPNRPDCAYPNKDLCGAGVAFKLALAFLEACGWPSARLASVASSMLKLVAVATVADVVPLTGENRAIVACGLAGFDDIRNPGLRALLKVSGFHPGDIPTARQVAFQIGPRINAAGRMNTAREVIELFTTNDEAAAARIAADLNALNAERQKTEAEMVEAILAGLAEVPVTEADAALVFSNPGWHKGVVGIVAGRIVERFHRPVFVLSEDAEKGEASGSGRSNGAFHLVDSLERLSDLFRKFGGHAQAAGVTLPIERVAEFRERFRADAAARLSPDDFRPVHEVDAVLPASSVGAEALADLARLAPFGHRNPPPALAILGAEITGPLRNLGDKGHKGLARQNGSALPFKAWRFHHRLDELALGRAVDLLFHLEPDKYDGWSATLKDVREARACN
ncbi:MAG: single-stranded-DNA-specific exonuclease RecJ [Bryobacter sp.]|nr:single-stranded-DNA-specific exonuclease RecJ [Bryobacter sp.]